MKKQQKNRHKWNKNDKIDFKLIAWRGGTVDKKFGQGPPPPPLIWTKSKSTATFFAENRPLMSLIVECGQVPSPSCHLLLFEPTHPTRYKASVDWSYCANTRVHIKTKSFHNVLTSFHLPFNIQSAFFAQQWLYHIFVKKSIWLWLF